MKFLRERIKLEDVIAILFFIGIWVGITEDIGNITFEVLLAALLGYAMGVVRGERNAKGKSSNKPPPLPPKTLD